MRKTLLTILVSTLLITNALAADDGNRADCIKLDKSTLPAGGQNLASLDKATRAIASKSKEAVIDLDTLARAGRARLRCAVCENKLALLIDALRDCSIN